MNTEMLLKLLQEKKYPRFKEELLKKQNVDIAEFIDTLDAKATLLVFRLLPKEIAADVFSYLSPESQSQLSVAVNEEELQEILNELFFDDKIDFLEEMPANVVKRILRNSPETERNLINQFLKYPDDSAGSIMTIEFVDFKKELLVRQALERIREYAPVKETVYTCYVTDSSRHLEGIVSLRDLVIASPEKKLAEIMNTKIISVKTTDDKEYVADLMKKYDLLAIPVTDNENRLVGIITVDDIVDVIEEENTEDFHKMATVGKIDINLLDAGPFFLLRKRLPWLLVLIFMNIFSGAGIAYFENTIQTVIGLVFFLPLLINSAGNAGSQAAALMIRALALGDVKTGDWFRLLQKEIIVSVLLGIAMAAAVSLIGFVQGGLNVAVIVALAMAAVVLVGSTIGMSLPFLLDKLKRSATASGRWLPLLRTLPELSFTFPLQPGISDYNIKEA